LIVCATDNAAAAAAAPVSTFCDAHSYLESVRYLNSNLKAHGFSAVDLPAACAVPTADASAASVAASDSAAAKAEVVNTLYRLLVAHQQSVEYRNDTSAKLEDARARHSDLSARHTALTSELHSEKHRAWVAEMKRRSSEADSRKAEARLRATIADLEKKNVQIQRRDKQYIVRLCCVCTGDCPHHH
jgi:hypothetical protein